MSTATITVEYDEETQTTTCITCGDGDALAKADEIMHVYQAREDHGTILAAGDQQVH